MRLCSGCQSKVANDVRFCDACKAERAGKGTGADGIKRHSPFAAEADGIREHSSAVDGEVYAFLYTHRRWHSGTRPKALMKHPFCSRCGIVPTDIIDHVVPAGEAIRQVQASGRFPYDKYAGFFLLSNLDGLCRSCHALKTKEDKEHTGEWPSVLEEHDRQPKKVWSF
jgi:hypothetical protein